MFCQVVHSVVRTIPVLFLVLTFVSAGLSCQIEFKSDLADLVNLEYLGAPGKIAKLKLTIANGGRFEDMLVDDCKDQLSKFRVFHREVGQNEWSSNVRGRKNINLETQEAEMKIKPCSQYEIKIEAEHKDKSTGKVESEVLPFGPYYNELTEEEIATLGSDNMDDDNIAEGIKFSEIGNNGFLATWPHICAQSLQMFLIYGSSLDEIDYANPVKTVNDIRPEGFNNSIWVPASPCSRYKLKIYSSMTAKYPVEYDQDLIADVTSDELVITNPNPDTVVTVNMEEGSTVLAWEFDKQQEECFSDTQIRYEIDIASEDHNLNLENETLGEWKNGTYDLAGGSTNPYKSCTSYTLTMNIFMAMDAGNMESIEAFNKEVTTNKNREFGPNMDCKETPVISTEKHHSTVTEVTVEDKTLLSPTKALRQTCRVPSLWQEEFLWEPPRLLEWPSFLRSLPLPRSKIAQTYV